MTFVNLGNDCLSMHKYIELHDELTSIVTSYITFDLTSTGFLLPVGPDYKDS